MLLLFVFCALAVALVLIPAVIAAFRDWREVARAVEYVRSLNISEAPANVHGQFCKALARYIEVFHQAVAQKTLTTFNVDNQLGSARRAAASIGTSVRALSGVLILCGLIITLSQLQGAVGGLKSTFDQLAAQQSNTSAAIDTAAQVVGGMSTVATAARHAFLISFIAILFAATLLLTSLLMNLKADRVFSTFSECVYNLHREELKRIPEQVPLNVVAAEFKSSAQALERLTSSFGDMTKSFGALQGFADSMDRARNAIVDAMQKLPAHIQASMGALSDRFVLSVTEGLRDANEHSDQILLIYGQQQQRIEKIQAEVAAIRQFSSQVAQAIAKLDGLPEKVAAVAAGVETESKSLSRFESTVAELAIRVEDLPIAGLREDVSTLASVTESIRTAVASVERFGGHVAESTDLLRDLPELVKGIDKAVRQEAESAAAFRDSVDILAKHVKTLPVPELRAGIDGLANAADKIGNIHAQTIAALSEVTHRSAAFESVGSELKATIEEVLKYSNRLAIHQQEIKAGLSDHAHEIADRLGQLADRIQTEIQKLKENEQLQEIQHAFSRLSLVVNDIKRDLSAIRVNNPQPESAVDGVSPETRVQN